MNHKQIKRFQVKVEFQDDSGIPRLRYQYESMLTHDMRSKGYVRVLDIDTNFSVQFDGETWVFLMTLYGVYVGKKKAWLSEGITQGKLIPNDFEAMRFIAAEETAILNNFDEVMAGIFEEKPDFEEFSQDTLNRLHADLAGNKDARDYLESRGINEESMKHFNLGYSPSMNMVTTPVHSPDGTPIGLVGRSIEGKSFKNSTNLPKSKTLFNVHRAKRIGNHVIIVESNFDAIRIHQAGFPNVVAVLGGILSTEQHKLLNRYFNKITVMTDSDLAGRELGLSIANRLKNKDLLWASYEYGKIYPHDAKDAGDMTDEEIKACIVNAVSDIEYRSWA